MKVSELIEKLQELEGNYTVLIDTVKVDDIEVEQDNSTRTVTLITLS